MKKSYYFLSFLIILYCFSAVAFAEGSIFKLSSTATNLKQGDEFTVKLSAESLGAGVGGPIVTTLTFDSTVLELKPTVSSLGSAYTCTLDPVTSTITITKNEAEVSFPTGNLELATLSFKVKDTAKVGPINIISTTDAPNNITGAPPISLTISQKPSNNATLTTLTINNNDFTPTFKSNVLTGYTLAVPYEVTDAVIYALPAETTAKIKGAGKKALLVGKNIISIEVTAPDLITKKTYIVSVERLAATGSSAISSQSFVSSEVDTNTTPKIIDAEAQKKLLTMKEENARLDEKYKKLAEKFAVVVILLLVLAIGLIAYIIVLALRLRESER